MLSFWATGFSSSHWIVIHSKQQRWLRTLSLEEVFPSRLKDCLIGNIGVPRSHTHTHWLIYFKLILLFIDCCPCGLVVASIGYYYCFVLLLDCQKFLFYSIVRKLTSELWATGPSSPAVYILDDSPSLMWLLLGMSWQLRVIYCVNPFPCQDF